MSLEREDQPIGTADLLSAGDRARVVPIRDSSADTQRGSEINIAREPHAEMKSAGQDGLGQEVRRDRHETGQPRQGAIQEELEALFDPDDAQRFRTRWTEVQSGFVDDPRQAVQHADELVAELMRSLAQRFARQRSEIEAGALGEEQASTENLRIALRSYRSFFERLLSL